MSLKKLSIYTMIIFNSHLVCMQTNSSLNEKILAFAQNIPQFARLIQETEILYQKSKITPPGQSINPTEIQNDLTQRIYAVHCIKTDIVRKNDYLDTQFISPDGRILTPELKEKFKNKQKTLIELIKQYDHLMEQMRSARD